MARGFLQVNSNSAGHVGQPAESIVMSFMDHVVCDSHRCKVSDDILNGGVIGDTQHGFLSMSGGQGQGIALSHLAL
jgi:hypothetical protein